MQCNIDGPHDHDSDHGWSEQWWVFYKGEIIAVTNTKARAAVLATAINQYFAPKAKEKI